MTNKYWNNLKQYGFIISPYSLIRSIGGIETLILMQIISEYGYAEKNKNIIEGYFLINLKRMSIYVNISEMYLKESLNILRELGFINFFSSGIEDTIMITPNIIKIIEFKENFEKENQFDDWDCGLLRAQNPINRNADFHSLTKQLQQIVDDFNQKLNSLPIIVYVYISCIFNQYERIKNIKIDSFVLLEEVKNLLLESKNFKEDFINFISDKYLD